jgi:hypothetical protein
MKSMGPRNLDVSIVHVKDQDPINMATIWIRMDGFFEYLNNPLCQKGFTNYVHRFLKGKKHWFKHSFTHKTWWIMLSKSKHHHVL